MKNEILEIKNKIFRLVARIIRSSSRPMRRHRISVLVQPMSSDTRLFGTNDPPYLGKVFLIENGRKHWLPSVEHAKVYGFNYPQDVKWVGADMIRSFELAGPVPLPHSNEVFLRPSTFTNPWEIREIMLSQLKGAGIEFGAANNPLPVPLNVNCEYADIVTDTNSVYTSYFGKDTEFVPIKYKTSLDKMNGIEDNSLDFILTSHVIEHLPNSLLVLEQSWRKLKAMGRLVLIVPHRDYTFDQNRETTSLQHIIDDYYKPLRERDILHYVEFFSKGLNFIKPIEEIYKVVKDCYENNAYDLHYHTWTEESFKAMVEYFSQNVLPFKTIWSHNCLAQKGGNEFYVILEKSD